MIKGLIGQHNFIPYLLIVIMGLLLWMAWDRGNHYEQQAEQAKADHALALMAVNEDMMLIQKHLARSVKIKQISKQLKGKYEIIIAGDQ
jgi:hypothetical protein